MARRLKRAVQDAFWRGAWGKLCAILVALAAIAPAAPADVVTWLHGILPGVPGWIVQAVAVGVLLARLGMMRRAVSPDVEIEERRRR